MQKSPSLSSTLCEVNNAESFAHGLRQQHSIDDLAQTDCIRRRPNHQDRRCLRFCHLEYFGATSQLCAGSEPR